MTRNYRRIMLSLVAFLGLFGSLAGQSQIVFVDVNRVLGDSAQGKAETARLNNLITRRSEAIDAERDSLNNLQKQLTEQLTPNPAETARIQQQMQAKQTQIQRMQEDAQAELSLEQELVVQKLSENLRALLADLAEERGYGAVLMRSPDRQVYVRDALDITDEVIRLYDERYPAS